MDEFIKLLNQDYELVRYLIKDKEVIFHIKSGKRELSCPFCGSKSMHVHSTYQREISKKQRRQTGWSKISSILRRC